MSEHKKFIKNYALAEIEEYFTANGLQSYRAKQLFNWLYERNISDFNDMTNFSKDLRAKLSEEFSVAALTLEERLVSKIDGTEKYLFRTYDGHYIESVLVKNESSDEGRLTICVSSQVGCAMNCSFCQTGKLGFTRNLEVAEILDQINQVRRESGLLNNNIVFMGMGEPFNNYENVIKSADIMNYTFGFHISVRKITISTCGILPVIRRFIEEEQPYNLAISLNDTDPEKRRINMPVEKSYPIIEIAKYINKHLPISHNRLTLEYVMRSDNIGDENVRKLGEMFDYDRIKINVIPLHDGEHKLGIPSRNERDQFIDKLRRYNIPVSVRKDSGWDISGACGQLSGKKYKDDANKGNNNGND